MDEVRPLVKREVNRQNSIVVVGVEVSRCDLQESRILNRSGAKFLAARRLIEGCRRQKILFADYIFRSGFGPLLG